MPNMRQKYRDGENYPSGAVNSPGNQLDSLMSRRSACMIPSDTGILRGRSKICDLR
jgi:hypothetical protein